jgi:hypothetical protein
LFAGQQVHLIDTPGFDDTNHSDVDTLKTIANYLSASFANGVRLGGIIYLHRISDNRLGGSGMRNLSMFKKLSGPGTWPNTIIGTTMWNANEYAQGIAREKELSNDPKYLGDLLAGGAKLFRCAEHGAGANEQKLSALNMIATLLKQIELSPKIELDIQRELVNDGRTLDNTHAGREALGDLYDMRLQLSNQLKSTHRDMQEALRARDVASAQQLQAVEADFVEKLNKTEAQQAELKTSLMEMHDREVQKLLKRLDAVDAQQRRKLRTKQKELEDMEESLKLMREQSAIDEARWKRQRIDDAELKKKQRARLIADHDAEQSVLALRKDVIQENKDLEAVGKAKGVVRNNIVNGVSNGVAAAGATALATVGTELCLRKTRKEVANIQTALGLMCVMS